MTKHAVVSQEEWLKARKALLDDEKEFTRARDRVSEKRRALPWEHVTKPYVFEGASGKKTLPQLFDGRSQLVVYHFMFDPEWKAGCKHCSFWADNFDRIIVHLNARDVSMVAVSRAPFEKLAAYRQRMGWSFEWLSSGGSTFNYDFHVAFPKEQVEAKKADYNFRIQDPGDTEREGISVFALDEGEVYRTYSTFARGIDLMNTAYNYLDLVPKGRDEGGRGPFWVRRHDEYGS